MTPYNALLGISRGCGPRPRNAMQGNVFQPHSRGPRPGYPICAGCFGGVDIRGDLYEGLGSWCSVLDRGNEARVVTVREGGCCWFRGDTRVNRDGIGGI